MRFILLLVAILYTCGSRDVTVLLHVLHLPLLKDESMLLFKGCDHLSRVIQVAEWDPFVCFSAIAFP